MTRWAIFEIFGYNFFYKSSPINIITFCAIYKNVTFQVKPAAVSFWASIGKFGLLFIQTSGHSVYGRYD